MSIPYIILSRGYEMMSVPSDAAIMWYSRRTPDGILLARFDNVKDAMAFEQGIAYIEQTDSRPVVIGYIGANESIDFDTADTEHGENALVLY
jgi:hypothetical protein